MDEGKSLCSAQRDPGFKTRAAADLKQKGEKMEQKYTIKKIAEKMKPGAKQAGQFLVNWVAVVAMPLWVVPYGIYSSIKNNETGWMTGKVSIF